MAITSAEAPSAQIGLRRRHRLVEAVVTGIILMAAIAVRGVGAVGIVMVGLLFVVLERSFSLRPQRTWRPGWATDVVHLFVNQLLTGAGVLVVAVAASVAGRLLLGDSIRAAIGQQARVWQILEVLAIAELVGYWAHRASHRIAWWWRFHRVHHSSEQMDWLAAGRVHPVDQILARGAIAAPIAAMGFGRALLGGLIVLFTLQAIFVHANVRWSFRRLRLVVATPEFHHWHHSNVPEAYNSNFAGEFPVLDAVFGTLYLPKVGDRFPDRYGTDRPAPTGYLRQLAWPWRPDRPTV